jgi:putative hemolysin
MTILLVIVAAFFSSMFFSGIETAFTSFDRILVITWLRARKFGARTVHFFSARPDRFLGAALIGNTIANVAYSSLLAILADEAGIAPVWLLTVSPLLVLVFAEVLPKMVGYTLSNIAVRVGAFPLLLAYYAFTPVRMVLLPLMKVLTHEKSQVELISGEPLAMRKELDQILVGAEAEGTLSSEEGEILERYLDARDLKVRQIMTPRIEMIAVHEMTAPDEVRQIFRKHRYNVLPVYRENLDHIIGIIRARDFLSEDVSILSVMRPLRAVPESKRIVDLLKEFKVTRRQYALVVDEYGGTDGFVTLKDIFEELVGPVAERWDPAQAVIKRIAPGKFLVSGSAFLEDIQDATGWVPPASEANTLAGLISDKEGRIPDVGEDINIDGVIVRIIKGSPRKVEGCLLKMPLKAEKQTE